MKKNLFVQAAFAAAVLTLTACSSEPAKTSEVKTDTDAAKKTPAGPPEPVTGKTAFYEMYTPAHTWAADMLPLSLKSGEVTGVKNADGKAGLWTAVFGSLSLHQARTYTYAVAEQVPDIAKGIKAESPVAWSGPTTVAMTFQTSDFTVDSDAAYKTAAEKVGDWLKDPAHAASGVTMSLGAAQRFPAPVWYFLFGDTKSGFQIFINATTGNVITK
ncbi:MAG TPA: hypothetical protein VG297_22020 [Bryobacteraceae bacterium]|nr:hypothetical protein [Bryobacteraceae bacterium]